MVRVKRCCAAAAVALFLLLVTAFVSFGCAQREDAQDLPQLTIGFDDCPPYSSTNEDGVCVGIDVDLAKEACRRMGYNPVFRKINWSDCDALLNAGEIDCLWSCYGMDGKEDDYAWVGPYMYGRQVIAVLASSSLYTLDDLTDKTVAVKAFSPQETLLLDRDDELRFSLDKVYCLPGMSEVVAALRNDYVDACVGFNATLVGLFDQAGVSYRMLEPDLDLAALGVAFPRGIDSSLPDSLKATLIEMHEDGTTARILKSHDVDHEKAMTGMTL